MGGFLCPDRTREEGGLTIHQKLIPDTARWNRDVREGSILYRKGTPYKANRRLSGGSGRVRGITIHNTGRISVPEGTTPAEQYTRATWPNCNMGSVRVHYYVDDVCAWQNLREDEVGWHAADGSGPGNETTLAVEIIMDGSGSPEDRAAEENGARLTALLLRRHGLTLREVYQHHTWYPRKNCPAYLRPRWEEFMGEVRRFYEEDAPPSPRPGETLRRIAAELLKLAESI